MFLFAQSPGADPERRRGEQQGREPVSPAPSAAASPGRRRAPGVTRRRQQPKRQGLRGRGLRCGRPRAELQLPQQRRRRRPRARRPDPDERELVLPVAEPSPVRVQLCRFYPLFCVASVAAPDTCSWRRAEGREGAQVGRTERGE